MPQTGLATFYAPGLMQQVQGYREARAEIGLCPDCVGAVALLRAGDIGRKVWLQPPEGEPAGPFLVVDCARLQDVAPLQARNWAVDVSYELGQLWGMSGPLDGVIVLEDPADALPGDPSRVPTPFAVLPDQVEISAPTSTPIGGLAVLTPWPTRLPKWRPGGAEALSVPVQPTPLPTHGPAPLIPLVTTPTPEAVPTSAGRVLWPSATPQPPPDMPADQAAGEISLGHAGANLLDPIATPVRLPANRPIMTVIPRAPTRTPRPDLTPILPVFKDRPAPVRDPDISLLMRLWQALIEALTR